MKIEIEIRTPDRKVLSDVMGQSSPSAGTVTQIQADTTLTYKTEFLAESSDAANIFYFVLTYASGVSSSIVANWLWSKLKGKSGRVVIDRSEVEFEEGQIKRILNEKIDKEG